MKKCSSPRKNAAAHCCPRQSNYGFSENNTSAYWPLFESVLKVYRIVDAPRFFARFPFSSFSFLFYSLPRRPAYPSKKTIADGKIRRPRTWWPFIFGFIELSCPYRGTRGRDRIMIVTRNIRVPPCNFTKRCIFLTRLRIYLHFSRKFIFAVKSIFWTSCAWYVALHNRNFPPSSTWQWKLLTDVEFYLFCTNNKYILLSKRNII